MRAIDIVRRLAPRAHPNYVAAFERGEAALAAAGINTPLRLAHFLAQVAHETGGFRILRESGRYSAERIMEIFGVGKHSAGVTWAEAKRLAGNGEALFDRVYGLGNPRKARELGNTEPGDGPAFRGAGLNQGTGRGFFARASRACGVDFCAEPDLATSPEWALPFALAEWDQTFLTLSDRNDIRAVTKRLNGGYNGLADRIRWFDRIWNLLREAGAATDGSWRTQEPDPAVKAVQRDLAALGYDLQIDGRQGPATEAAIRAFQSAHGISVDGVAGPVTRAAIETALAGCRSPKPESANPPIVEDAAGKGGGLAGGGVAGEVVLQQAEKIEPLAEAVPWLRIVVIAVTLIGVGLILYGAYRHWRPRPGAPA